MIAEFILLHNSSLKEEIQLNWQQYSDGTAEECGRTIEPLIVTHVTLH